MPHTYTRSHSHTLSLSVQKLTKCESIELGHKVFLHMYSLSYLALTSHPSFRAIVDVIWRFSPKISVRSSSTSLYACLEFLYKQCTSSLPLFQRNTNKPTIVSWNSFGQPCPSSVDWRRARLPETVSTYDRRLVSVTLEKREGACALFVQKLQTCLPTSRRPAKPYLVYMQSEKSILKKKEALCLTKSIFCPSLVFSLHWSVSCNFFFSLTITRGTPIGFVTYRVMYELAVRSDGMTSAQE